MPRLTEIPKVLIIFSDVLKCMQIKEFKFVFMFIKRTNFDCLDLFALIVL